MTRSLRQRARRRKPKSLPQVVADSCTRYGFSGRLHVILFRSFCFIQLMFWSAPSMQSPPPFRLVLLFVLGPLASCFEFGVSDEGPSVWDLATQQACAPEVPTRVLKFPASAPTTRAASAALSGRLHLTTASQGDEGCQHVAGALGRLAQLEKLSVALYNNGISPGTQGAFGHGGVDFYSHPFSFLEVLHVGKAWQGQRLLY